MPTPVINVDFSGYKGTRGTIIDDGDYEIRCGPNPTFKDAGTGTGNQVLDLANPIILDPDAIGVAIWQANASYGKTKKGEPLLILAQAVESLFSYNMADKDPVQVRLTVTQQKQVAAQWFSGQKLAVRLAMESDVQYGDRMTVRAFLTKSGWEAGAKDTPKGKCGARRPRAPAQQPIGMPSGFASPPGGVPFNVPPTPSPDVAQFLGPGRAPPPPSAAQQAPPSPFAAAATPQQPNGQGQPQKNDVTQMFAALGIPMP